MSMSISALHKEHRNLGQLSLEYCHGDICGPCYAANCYRHAHTSLSQNSLHSFPLIKGTAGRSPQIILISVLQYYHHYLCDASGVIIGIVNNGMIVLACFYRCAQELLCESGNEDECVADVGVSGEQLPLPLYCECRQDVKHTAWRRNKSIPAKMYNS